MNEAIIREKIKRAREALDDIERELSSEAAPKPSSLYMKIGDFAALRGFSPRTIRDWCDLGMPHVGEGHNRRVLVADASQWIDGGGPKRARMARTGGAR